MAPTPSALVFSIVALLSLASPTTAQKTTTTRTVTAEYCYTQKGSSAVHPVPTVFETYSDLQVTTRTVTVKSTPIAKFTPDPVTTTITLPTQEISTFTASLPTGTATETNLVTVSTEEVAQQTTTITDFSTSTSTYTSTPIVTASAPNNFIPAASNVPGAVFKLKKRAREPRPAIQLNSALKVNKFDKKVECMEFIETLAVATVTRTAKPSTKTLAPVTKEATDYTTLTVVQTEYPDGALTTVTQQVTTTVTTATRTPEATSTSVVTAVETAIGPIQTQYAACGSNNLISHGNGGAGYFASFYNIRKYAIVSGINSAYDCCVAALQNPNFAVGGFASQCVIVTQDTCSYPGQWPGSSSSQLISGPYTGWTIFNGYCGTVSTV